MSPLRACLAIPKVPCPRTTAHSRTTASDDPTIKA